MFRSALLFCSIISLAVVGLAMATSRQDSTPTLSTAAGLTQTIEATPSYRTEVIRLDDIIENLNARSHHDPRSWLALQSLAASYRQRAQLTGEHLDYVRADAALTRAFAIAPSGAGPFLIRAQLNSSLHRYALIEGDLQAAASDALLDERSAATIASLRADSAFVSGHYALAEPLYRRALTLRRDYLRLFALADFLFATGEREQAEPLMDEAERTVPQVDHMGRAWVRLQRGLMEESRGHWDTALAHYRAADTAMPGWWMVAMRIAAIQAQRGERAEAIAAYRTLIAQTDRPDCYDGLAALLLKDGCIDEAGALIRRARQRYDLMLQDDPQSAYGHALAHFLTLQKEPALTVTIAERNRDLRPGGEALTKLAQAYLQAGRLADARATIRTVVASPWSMAESHALAARIYSAGGETEMAQVERARAIAINPHQLDAQ